MLRRLLAGSALLVVTVLATLGTTAPSAQALPYPPVIRIPVITASAYDPCAGASNIIGGYRFLPGETVQLFMQGNGIIGRAVVAEDGSFTTTVTIPLEARGSNQVTVIGETSGRRASLTLEVPCVVDQTGDGSGGGSSGSGGGSNGRGGSGSGGSGNGTDGASGFSSGGGALASTGAAIGGAVVLGIVLFGVGGALTMAGRRRHGRSAAR